MKRILSLLLAHASLCFSQSWQSAIVNYDESSRLRYAADPNGNRVPDFSYAGYKNGMVAIPDIAVVDSVSPVPGDNTANIQAGINRVAALPLDAQGFRGALLMKAGFYRVSGTLRLNGSGVVLRGVGEGSDSLVNSIIYATGDSLSQPIVLVAGGGKTGSNSSAWSGSLTPQVNIVTDTVHVGERSFRVADPGPFAPGDNIVIVHPKTTEWLREINFGDVPNDTGTGSYWASQTIPILYNRYITAIDGDLVTIDAPVFANLVRSLSQSYIYKTDRVGILTNIGIENLRIDIINPYDQSPAANGDEYHHAQDAIWLGKIEDAWAKHVTTLHFVQSGFKTSLATRVTVDSCSAIDPISIITGERRYNFNTYVASQLILFSNCYASYARHAYISNGTSTVSGIVVYNCVSEESYNASEGHRLWSQGFLFDNFIDKNTNVSLSNFVLGLYNRGNYGSGHGWAAVHSVAWNCSTGNSKIVIQKPPTAQNYAIGCAGNVTGNGPFAHPAGYIEGSNNPGLNPPSLYEAQLAERISDAAFIDRSHIIEPGWNLVSLPVDMGRIPAVQLFPSAISTPFVFDGSYQAVDTVSSGSGFWIKYSSADTVSYHGLPINSDTVGIKQGWNMVGSISAPVDTAAIASEPEGIIASKFYLYDGSSYQAASTIEPGTGYWVKGNAAGRLIISGTMRNNFSNRPAGQNKK